MFLAILAIILTLILVVGIHEAGHALAARFFQVKINKISIGFGKPLVSWQSASGCEWIWAWLPLGGYVQLQNTRISPVVAAEQAYCFDKKPIWQRVVILLAGIVANLIMAWFAFVLVFGLGLNYKQPIIQTIEPTSRAAQAGMQAGYQFISISGQATSTWSEVGMQLLLAWGKNNVLVSLQSEDSQTVKTLTLDLSKVVFWGKKNSLLGQLGIQPKLATPWHKLQASSLGDAMGRATQTLVNLLYFFLILLKQIILGIIPFTALLGPVGIFAVSLSSLMQGLVVFVYFIGTLSLAVAMINLFPIPGLDGGSIVYALIEKIRGQPVSIAMELLLHRLAFIIFCILLVHLMMNDLQRL